MCPLLHHVMATISVCHNTSRDGGAERWGKWMNERSSVNRGNCQGSCRSSNGEVGGWGSHLPLDVNTRPLWDGTGATHWLTASIRLITVGCRALLCCLATPPTVEPERLALNTVFDQRRHQSTSAGPHNSKHGHWDRGTHRYVYITHWPKHFMNKR